MNTAKAVTQYPNTVYEAWEKPLRHFDCTYYSDCLDIVSQDHKATGFGCEGCPQYKKPDASGKKPSATIFPMRKPYEIREIPVDAILVDTRIDRSMYKSITASLKTIKEIFSPPILLDKEDGTFACYAGRRRVLAARAENIDSIECKVFAKETPEQVMRLYEVAENMVRKANAASEAESISYLISANRWTEKQTAEKLGIPLGQVKSRLNLLKLIPGYFSLLKEGKITVSVGNRLSTLPEAKQAQLFSESVTKLKTVNETARAAKLDSLLAKDHLFSLPYVKKAPLNDAIKSLKVAIDYIAGDTKPLKRAMKIMEAFKKDGAL